MEEADAAAVRAQLQTSTAKVKHTKSLCADVDYANARACMEVWQVTYRPNMTSLTFESNRTSPRPRADTELLVRHLSSIATCMYHRSPFCTMSLITLKVLSPCKSMQCVIDGAGGSSGSGVVARGAHVGQRGEE